jgi:multidrug efflux pump subunit AcrB
MSARIKSSETGLIAWFAGNHVAANLLMAFILVAGLISSLTIRKQTTPDFVINNVQVRVPYLGAAPQEVEEGVVIKVEEAVQDIDGIRKIIGTAREGLGTVTVEVATGVDLDEVLGEVKTRVDAISTFPALTEKPVIYKQEIPIHVVFISLYGDLDEYSRKRLAQEVRDELMAIPSVNQVQNLGDRDYEISIEVSEHVLRQYALTMSEISAAVRNSSVDLPGGTINTSGGNILLRTEGQVYTGQEFATLVLRTYPDGTRLTLGDIATINDGFVEVDGYSRHNGQPTALLRVLAGGEQNELATAAAVNEYIERKSETLPPGVTMEAWIDRAYYLQGRLDLMTKNMVQGALLVFLVLTLFLRLKVAAWVIVGIPITFFGALWLMPITPLPVTINMISLFAFILVLGIVVDDAIIIGESVYTTIRADGHTLDNVIRGARRVAVPATFGVLTTMAAFAPMLFVGTFVEPFFIAMSMVVILCLLFSLIESKLILPAHLVHAKIKPVDEAEIFSPYRDVNVIRRVVKFFQRVQRHTQHFLHSFIHNTYAPALGKAVDNRGITVVSFFAALIVTGGLIAGVVRVVLFPEVPGDFIHMQLEMQEGTAPEVRNQALDKLESSILAVNNEFMTTNPGAEEPINHVGTFAGDDASGDIFVEISKNVDRELQAEDITDLWRQRVGDIAGIKTITFSDGNNIGGGAPISFNLTGANIESLERAAKELEEKLTEYEGVFDITNSLSRGGEEIRLAIKPEAQALGLTIASLGRQVRQAFYGEEAQRIQRGKDEVKVMVRYPREDRRSISDLENMRIRTPDGDEVPFYSVAEITFGEAYSTILRQNRERSVTVSADADPLLVEPGKIIEEISNDFVPGLLARYPGLKHELEGASLELLEFQRNASIAAIAAFFLIYALIAIPLHSYTQPIIVMIAIPFGLVGAVIGHIIMGKAISMFSLFGFIALGGVVVNDSLIMVDFINKARAEGVPIRDAVIQSGTQRFRAIILTSLTTAVGLMPIMLEKSVQAQFLIPMAISMAFGIIFATVITLFLIPAMYMLLLDLKYWQAKFRYLILGDEEKYHAVTRVAPLPSKYGEPASNIQQTHQ